MSPLENQKDNITKEPFPKLERQGVEKKEKDDLFVSSFEPST